MEIDTLLCAHVMYLFVYLTKCSYFEKFRLHVMSFQPLN